MVFDHSLLLLTCHSYCSLPRKDVASSFKEDKTRSKEIEKKKIEMRGIIQDDRKQRSNRQSRADTTRLEEAISGLGTLDKDSRKSCKVKKVTFFPAGPF
jgi:hypothetical protein